MSDQVVTLRPETTMAEAIRMLTKHHLGGAPVVSVAGTLEGMISDSALLDVVFDPAVKGTPVSEYMDREVHVVNVDDPISCAAQLFALYSFRRLPVVDHGQLVGIVTRRDLMNHALESNESLTEPLFEMVPALGQLT
jgi:tRNA nucleotidyltransferase (CCA-adding enzyme)